MFSVICVFLYCGGIFSFLCRLDCAYWAVKIRLQEVAFLLGSLLHQLKCSVRSIVTLNSSFSPGNPRLNVGYIPVSNFYKKNRILSTRVYDLL